MDMGEEGGDGGARSLGTLNPQMPSRQSLKLLSLYGQMVCSPDLIPSEVESLTDEFAQKVLAAKKRARELEALSLTEPTRETQERDAIIGRMNSRVGLLDL